MKIRFVVLVVVTLLFGFSIGDTMQGNIRKEVCTGYNNNCFISYDGNVWEISDTIENGKEYIVYFSDNNTLDIYDDIIINYQ